MLLMIKLWLRTFKYWVMNPMSRVIFYGNGIKRIKEVICIKKDPFTRHPLLAASLLFICPCRQMERAIKKSIPFGFTTSVI